MHFRNRQNQFHSINLTLIDPPEDPRKRGMLHRYGRSTFVYGIRVEESLAQASQNLAYTGRNYDGHRRFRRAGRVFARI
jgi:hypothetical protein